MRPKLIVYGKIVARVIVYVTLFQTWISTHGANGAPPLNLMKHNETVLFYALLDLFFLLCNETTSKFILKQLDYSPSFSTSDSRRGCASWSICSWKTRARSLIVNYVTLTKCYIGKFYGVYIIGLRYRHDCDHFKYGIYVVVNFFFPVKF